MDCLFCRIVKGKLASEVMHENEGFLVIKDIHPQAPTHLLVIPKAHYPTLVDCVDEGVLGRMLSTAVEAAKKYGFAESGFRTVINTNREGGQTVFHLHMHILGGEPLSEKMV